MDANEELKVHALSLVLAEQPHFGFYCLRITVQERSTSAQVRSFGLIWSADHSKAVTLRYHVVIHGDSSVGIQQK
jgi:hypothetical protein